MINLQHYLAKTRHRDYPQPVVHIQEGEPLVPGVLVWWEDTQRWNEPRVATLSMIPMSRELPMFGQLIERAPYKSEYNPVEQPMGWYVALDGGGTAWVREEAVKVRRLDNLKLAVASCDRWRHEVYRYADYPQEEGWGFEEVRCETYVGITLAFDDSLGRAQLGEWFNGRLPYQSLELGRDLELREAFTPVDRRLGSRLGKSAMWDLHTGEKALALLQSEEHGHYPCAPVKEIDRIPEWALLMQANALLADFLGLGLNSTGPLENLYELHHLLVNSE
jgi:hypothetical protein